MRTCPGARGARRVLVSLIGLAASLATAVAAGKDRAGPDLGALSLEQLMNVEVVYAASKVEQDTREAPASVTLITAAEIRAYGYRTLGDILRGVRGFFITYDRNYTYVGARGFDRPGDYNSRLLLLIDGYRVNDHLYDAAYIGPEMMLDVDLIDRVEVVRGPSSSLYGASAFFGVINVITRDPAARPGVEVAAGAASWKAFEGQVDYAHQFAERWSMLASASGYSSQGQDLFYPEFDDPATNNGVAEGVDDESYARFFWKAAAGHWNFQVLGGSRAKTIPTGSFGAVFNDPRNETTDASIYASARWRNRIAGQVDLDARLSINDYGYRGDYVYDQGTPGNPLLVVNHDRADVTWWVVEVDATRRFGTRQRLTGGIESRGSLDQRQRNFDAAVTYFDDDRNTRALGVFVEDAIDLGSKVTLSAGVRYDQYDTFGGTTNPRLALVWAPAGKTAVKLLYGSAFRAPSTYELYYVDGFSQKANPDLQPETIRTTELAVEHRFSPALRLSGSAYVYRIDDLITQTLDPGDGLLQFRNLDAARARGYEVELAGRTRRGWQASLAYAYQTTEDEATGQRLTDSPRGLAQFHLIVPAAKGRITTGFEAIYETDRFTLQRNRVDGYLLGNLTITGRIIPDRLELQGSLYNLFDADYGDPGAGEHLQDVIDQDGRSARLLLRYRF